VRAYPPHAIRSDGVGPYRLDAPLSDVLHLLPGGPRVELLQVGTLVNWRVVRAEKGELLIGADTHNQVAFIAVLSREVARTEAEPGVGVGATGADLHRALGAEADVGEAARDRRVFAFAGLPNVRFLTDAPIDTPAARATVVAVLVARPELFPAGPPTGEGNRPACHAGGPLSGAEQDIAEAVLGRGAVASLARPLLRFGCFTGANPEAVAVGPGELAIFGGEPGRLRRVARLPLEAASWVSPLDVDGDGRDEIVVGVNERRPSERTAAVRLFRWEAGRLSDIGGGRPFSVPAAAAAANGVVLDDVDLAMIVTPQEGALSIGGYYLSRHGGRVRELAPLTPVRLRVSSRKGVVLQEEPAPDAATP